MKGYFPTLGNVITFNWYHSFPSSRNDWIINKYISLWNFNWLYYYNDCKSPVFTVHDFWYLTKGSLFYWLGWPFQQWTLPSFLVSWHLTRTYKLFKQRLIWQSYNEVFSFGSLVFNLWFADIQWLRDWTIKIFFLFDDSLFA